MIDRNNYKELGAKTYINDSEIQWIKDNLVIGKIIDEPMLFNQKTAIHLFEKIYYMNIDSDFKNTLNTFNIKIDDNEIFLLQIEKLKIDICFRPPLALFRKRKLERIIGE
jgi:hypothetical protein